MKNKLKLIQERISSETVTVANNIIKSTDAFMSGFSKDDIFSFPESIQKIF